MSPVPRAMETPRVTRVTDDRALGRAALWAGLHKAATLPPDARSRLAVQLRSPELSGRELHRLGVELRHTTASLGIKLIVNDRLDLAELLGADGVHLGRLSVDVADARRLLGDGVWVSVSCHSMEELARVASRGADAVVLSPVFESPGKTEPLGLEVLGDARRRLGPRVGLVALGGVTPERVGACLRAGADGVASIRADLMVACTGLSVCT